MLRPIRVLEALLVAVSIFMLISVAVADNTSFTVDPQKEHVITLNMRETDTISGSFSVVSDDVTGINFYVVDSFNVTILRYDNVKQRSFSLAINVTGDYQFHFDNSISDTYSKAVHLNYNIIHYIMGMPQEQFLFVIIAIVGLIALVAYIALMPK